MAAESSTMPFINEVNTEVAPAAVPAKSRAFTTLSESAPSEDLSQRDDISEGDPMRREALEALRMPSIEQHFLTRRFKDDHLERRYQKGRFRFWSTHVGHIMGFMTMAATYQTLLVTMKLTNFPLYTASLWYNFPAWHSMRTKGDYEMLATDWVGPLTAWCCLLATRNQRLFNVKTYQTFTLVSAVLGVFATLFTTFTHGHDSIFGSDPIKGHLGVSFEPTSAAVISGAWYITRTVVGMMIAAFGVGLEPVWAFVLCAYIALISRLRYMPMHAIRFGERFTETPLLETVPLLMIVACYYHVCNYARQAFVALIAVKVARSARIEQLHREKERLDIERAMLQKSIQKGRLSHAVGAGTNPSTGRKSERRESGGSVNERALNEAILNDGASVTSTEKRAEWMDDWAKTREAEMDSERQQRLESELTQALELDLQNLLHTSCAAGVSETGSPAVSPAVSSAMPTSSAMGLEPIRPSGVRCADAYTAPYGSQSRLSPSPLAPDKDAASKKDE